MRLAGAGSLIMVYVSRPVVGRPGEGSGGGHFASSVAFPLSRTDGQYGRARRLLNEHVSGNLVGEQSMIVGCSPVLPSSL
jgi:hypothetical protein